MRNYKLTYNQKQIMSKNGLNAADWLLESETEFYMKVVNKRTGERKNVSKYPARPIIRR